jgi:hypothetical protein
MISTVIILSALPQVMGDPRVERTDKGEVREFVSGRQIPVMICLLQAMENARKSLIWITLMFLG